MANHNSVKTSKPKLTVTQAKVVRAKIKAEIEDKSLLEVAPDVFPNAKPESARVMVQQHLQNITVQQALHESFAKLGLTTDTLTATVANAIAANKTVPIEGDLFETDVPDHNIRLKAAGMAANWMGIGKTAEGGTTNYNFISLQDNDRSGYGV